MKTKTTSTPPVQPGLFDSAEVHALAAKVAKLDAQVEHLKREVTWRERARQALIAERDTLLGVLLSDADHPMYAENASLKQEIAGLRKCLRHVVETYMLGRPSGAGWRDSDLKQFLLLAHPDKWSQGQPATELAHEITVVVNQLRTQGEWQR